MGTKCAAVHRFTVQPHCQVTVCCRLHHTDCVPCAEDVFGEQFDTIFSQRQRECHEFYSRVCNQLLQLLCKLPISLSLTCDRLKLHEIALKLQRNCMKT